MPLARILTRFPEQADALSQELRQHGYTVEFSTPELAGKSPADLEIDFEICAEPDALSRASELADQIHADVAVSPGVLDQPVLEHAEKTHLEQVEPAERPDNVLPFINPVQAREPEIAQEQQEKLLAEPVAQETIPPESTPVQEQVWEPEPMPPAAEVELPANMLTESYEPASELHPPVHSQTNTAFDDEIDLVRAAAPHDPEGESATELLARAGEKSATVLHAAGAAGQEVWGVIQKGAKNLQGHAREWMQRGREQVNLRREEFKMQRDQKAQEQERRRALEQERAAELEAAREAAAVRLQELLRERGGLTEAQPVPPQKPAEPTPLPVASATDKAPAGLLGRRIRIPFSRTYRPQLEAVLMGVAAAFCFFVLGLAVASFHARPAISDTIQQPSQAQPGYQGVTVNGGGVTVQAGTSAASPQKVNPAARPSPGTVAQGEEKPPATRASDVTVRNVPSPHRQTARRSGNSEHIGDDVVIRHFGTPVSAPAQTAPRAELKHYSDLDN
jgi:hypothetical protein